MLQYYTTKSSKNESNQDYFSHCKNFFADAENPLEIIIDI